MLFERDVSATESLYIIQATGFQSVFERCKIFRFSPNPHIPQEEQLNRETVGFTCFHQMFFIKQPSDKLRGKLTIIFPIILAFCRIIGCKLFDVLCRQPIYFRVNARTSLPVTTIFSSPNSYSYAFSSEISSSVKVLNP